MLGGPLGALGEAYVLVDLFSQDGKRSIPLSAKVDTGAYYPLVTEKVIRELGLTPISPLTLDTAKGPMPSHSYLTRMVATPMWDGNLVVVVGHPGNESMLLGRSWLSHFVFKYDGVARSFSITKPP